MEEDDLLQQAIALSLQEQWDSSQPAESQDEPLSTSEPGRSRKRPLEDAETEGGNPGPSGPASESVGAAPTQDRQQAPPDAEDRALQEAIRLSLLEDAHGEPAEVPQQNGVAVPPPAAVSTGQAPGSATPPPAPSPEQLAAIQSLVHALQQAGGSSSVTTAPSGPQPTGPTARRPGPVGVRCPGWVQGLQSWLPISHSDNQAASSLTLVKSDVAVLGSALTDILGLSVDICNSGQHPTSKPNSVSVILSSQPGSADVLQSDTVVDMGIRQRLQHRHLRGGPAIAALAQSHDRARVYLQASGTLSVQLQAAIQQWQTGFVRRALELSLQDSDDLFFEGGQTVRELLDALAAEHATHRVGKPFLEAMLAASGGEHHERGWENVLRTAFADLKSASFKEPWRINAKLLVLDVLLQPQPLQHALGLILIRETRAAVDQLGNKFEGASILSALLAVAPFPDILAALSQKIESPVKDIFVTLRGYPERRDQAESQTTALRYPLERCQMAGHQLLERVVRLKVAPAGLGREAVLAWLAAAVKAGEVRTRGGEGKGVLSMTGLRQGTTDRFALGVAALCLRFCRPFLPRDEAAVSKLDMQHLARLSADFYSTSPHRLRAALQEQTLAGRQEGHDALPACFPALAPDCNPAKAPHFVAECFFLAQRAMHTCLLPAVYRYNELATVLQRHGQDSGDDEEPKPARSTPLELWLLQDCCMAQLMEPTFAADAVVFSVLEAMWLHRLASQEPAQAQAAFRRIPESVVRDMTSWLAWVIRLGHAELLGGIPISRLLAALTALLQRPDLVRNAVVQSSIVELLSAMLLPLQRRSLRGVPHGFLWLPGLPQPTLACCGAWLVECLRGGKLLNWLPRRSAWAAGALGPTYMRPGEAALVAAVLGTGAAQEQLVPALMRVYAAADNVIGLDVDRDRFDKFHFRTMIDSLLEALWKDEGCRRSLTRIAAEAAASNQEDVFVGYVSAVLNSLLYLLPDSLHRLDGLVRVERARADEAGWQALSQEERSKMDSYYSGEQRTTTGFMGMARQGLRMVDTLSGELGEVIRSAFLRPPLLQLSAHAIIRIINTLMGPKAANLAVANPERYGYNSEDILVRMVKLCLRLAAASPGFLAVLTADPDFSASLMAATVERLAGSQNNTEARSCAPRLDDLLKLAASPWGPHAEAAASDNLDLQLPGQEPPNVHEQYCECLAELQVADFDSTTPGGYNRRYAQLATESAGDISAKMKRLSREVRDLQRGRAQLPLQPAASIFLRYDADRMDKIRACIVGPEDTPYAYGCFMFDIFVPQQYPNVPPLMVLETTGGGRARMGPNLYADGKVCLSLLGTFPGGDESAKWSPQYSSLFQLLMSVQTQLLTPDPYFNEPNTEQLRGTKEGTAADQNYNAGVVLATVRHAMVGALRAPRPGFEEVIRTHFKMLRHRLLAQCQKWLQMFADEGEAYIASLQRAVQELHSLLHNLEGCA